MARATWQTNAERLSVETGFTDANSFFSRGFLARTADQMSTPNKSGSPTLVPYRSDRQTLGAHLPVTSKGYTLEKEEGEAFPFRKALKFPSV